MGEMLHITIFPEDYEELKKNGSIVIPHYYWCKEGVRLKKNDSCYVGIRADGVNLGATVVGSNDRIVCLERW